jgi:hypothetical protein
MVIWGRAPDYDTGADAIVRVKANEIRKRLAQYNLEANPERVVTIALQAGSYVPQITRKESLEPVRELAPLPVRAGDEHIRVSRGMYTISGVLGAITLALLLALHAIFSATPINQFWEPILRQGEPIICTASPSAYNLETAKLLGPADSKTAFHVKSELQKLGRPSHIGKSDDVTLTDLKAAPVVLVGGPRVNRWSMWMTKDLRFTFETADNKRRVVDRDNPTRSWEDGISPTDNSLEEYVIVTRLLNSASGQPMICIAGLGPYGSQAGGWFVTDGASLKEVLKYAPENWAHKNLQFVLKTKISNGLPNMPELVAATFW